MADPVTSSPKSPVWYLKGDGFPFVDPCATREELIAYWYPDVTRKPGKIVVGTTTTRRRILDHASGKRVTRDLVAVQALLYSDGATDTLFNLESFRILMEEIRPLAQVDEVIVRARIVTYFSPRLKLLQFGVRERPAAAV